MPDASTKNTAPRPDARGENGAAPDGHDRPDFSLVLPLSLAAGGLAAYPSLSAAADGQGDLMGAVTLFLVATLVATFGFAIVAMFFHHFSAPAAPDDDDADDDQTVTGGSTGLDSADGPVPTVALNPPHDTRADAIDTALAPTDALLHDPT